MTSMVALLIDKEYQNSAFDPSIPLPNIATSGVQAELCCGLCIGVTRGGRSVLKRHTVMYNVLKAHGRHREAPVHALGGLGDWRVNK